MYLISPSHGVPYPTEGFKRTVLSLSLSLLSPPYYFNNPEFLKNANESMKSMGRGALWKRLHRKGIVEFCFAGYVHI